MEYAEYDNILTDICQATFHMNDEEAKPIIDEFIKDYPELLDFHDREWYYKNC